MKDLSSEWYAKLEETKADSMRPEDQKPPMGGNPPSGAGYLFTLEGLHYHHNDKEQETEVAGLYVVHTLLKNLKQWESHAGGRPVPVRAIGITHAVMLEAPINPDIYLYSSDPREQQLLMGQGGFGAGSPMDMNTINPMPMGADAEKKPIGKEIHQTKFRMQFVWQPVPKEEREVNDIIMELVAPKELAGDFSESVPNLEVPFSEIQAAVDKRNEEIKLENDRIVAENQLLPPEQEDSRKLTLALLSVTQEQYDAFKQRFLVKGTPETRPISMQGTATASGS
jgi:hypothetical protein